MLGAISFTVSMATAISNQDSINQFGELKDLSNDGKSMCQVEHLITVVRKPSGGKDGHVINARAQELFNPAFCYVRIYNKTSR